MSTLDVRSFKEADCDTYHHLGVAKLRVRLAVSKQAAQKNDGERLNLRKLNELEVRKQYQIKISNKFVALENSRDSKNVDRAGVSIKENIRTSAKESLDLHELKQHKQ